MNNWKVATIFVSSTFSDMNEERDVLNSYVIPKLNEYFYSKRISVHLVDLRWGVRTSEIENEVARDNKVLTVCFDEIERSQPFFVAILGDRYGYDELDNDIIDSISYKFDDSVSLHNKSVTELEILYGSLLHPEIQLSNSVFCMRQTDYTGMPKEIKQEYTQGVLKMNSLRDKIVENCRRFNHSENIIEYHVSRWDNTTKRFELFDRIRFGELLYAKLVNSISKHLERSEDANLSFPEQLLYDQETFLCSVDNAKGMNSRVTTLLEHSCQLNIIQGESGIGKTTLLKHLAQYLSLEWTSNTKHILYFNAGLSAKCRDVKNMLICWIWQIEKSLSEGIGDIEKLNLDELCTAFEFILQKGIEQGHEFLFVIDAYELIYKNAISESLSFLRFGKKSFIATQFDTNIHFHRDTDCQVINLPGLNLDEAKEMMMDLFVRHHKEWHSNLWDIIQNKFGDTISPLWIELAVDVLSSLSASDFLKIKALQTSANSGDETLEKYLISLVNDFPNSVPQMFEYLYNKVLEEENWSIQNLFYVWYIALSRNGIRESDLAALTKQIGCWDSLLFARIRYHFHSCIVEKGVDKCWGFSHEIYNKVIEIHIKKFGKRMNTGYLEMVQGALDNHLNKFLKSYIKEKDGNLFVDFFEMLHGALGHHYVHCDLHYDLRINECVYHLIHGNDKGFTAFFLLDSYAKNNIENDEYFNAIRDIVDFIINNHIDEKKYYKVPKGMPIPELGTMNNAAIIWLKEMMCMSSVVENNYCGQLLLIFATAITEELHNRGASSASLFLNMQLQSIVADHEIDIHEEFRIWLSILIENNIRKAQVENGNSYDVTFSKTDDTCKSIENKQMTLHSGNKDTVPNMIDYYAYYYEEIGSAQKESFMGNHNNAISICEELLNKDKLFSEKIDQGVYIELKYKCLLCLMDCYFYIGHNQKAFEIYKRIEVSFEKGEPRWFIIQERLFHFYYQKQSPKSLDVAMQYLSVAEDHFQLNKMKYDNIENLAHAFVLYLRALIMVDKENDIIEAIIMRAERFFSQILDEYKYNKQLLKSYSYVQELKGEYYYEVGKLKETESSLKRRLYISEFLSGREPLDHNASRDLIKANEDLGYFYLSCEDYIKAHNFFTDTLQYLCSWDDSEEKLKRIEEVYSGLCKAIESIEKGKAKNEIAYDRIRIEGNGYYYLSFKEYKKACEYFKKAINSLFYLEDSEEKFVRLSELYVVLCKAMAHTDKKEAQNQILCSKRIIENFPLEVRHYFIHQLDSINIQ